MFFKWIVLGKGGVDDVGLGPADSSVNAVSVAMAHWNVAQRVFVLEQFFRNSDSVVTVQRLFRRKFNVQFRIDMPYCDRLKHSELPDLSIRQEIAAVPAKNVWSVRCRTLRRDSECVSGKQDVI